MVLLAVVSALAQGMESSVQHRVLYSVAGGAVVGLIRMGSPVARYVGFLVGLVLGLAYFVLLAAVVPGDAVGQLIAGLVVVALAAIVSAFTGMWVQLWTVFLGVLLFIGAYQPLFDAQLWMFETQSVGTLASTIFLATIGFCVVIAVEIVGTNTSVRRTLDHEKTDVFVDPPDVTDTTVPSQTTRTTEASTADRTLAIFDGQTGRTK
jgi:hypothetical protein